MKARVKNTKGTRIEIEMTEYEAAMLKGEAYHQFMWMDLESQLPSLIVHILNDGVRNSEARIEGEGR